MVKRYDENSHVIDSVIASAQTNDAGVAKICLDQGHDKEPLFLSATHPSIAAPLSRYVGPNSKADLIVLDSLGTQLTATLLRIHELPFSGFIGKVTEKDFAIANSKLRSMSMTQKVQDRMSATLSSLPSIGSQLACFNSSFEEGTLLLGGVFSTQNMRALASNGSLQSVDGQALKGSSLIINDVNLYAKNFDIMYELSGGLNGTYMQKSNFDPQGSLDASVTYVELKDITSNTALPCVAGVLSVSNNARQKSQIAKDSSLCFSSLGDSLYESTSDQTIVFGAGTSSSTFVLSLPGIHRGTQSDGLQLSVMGQQACIRFDRTHELAPQGELGDLASALFTVCQVSDGQEIIATSNLLHAARSGFETSLFTPSASSKLSRKEVAARIGNADFINNPNVVSFLRSDIRDSLINFNQGNKANVFLSGKGANETYSVFLNGKGFPLAEIQTGPEGQFSGGLNLLSAKPGDFLRFTAFNHYFDVPIEDKCVR